jgi:tetratricopeptide (TPR) repeat protein
MCSRSACRRYFAAPVWGWTGLFAGLFALVMGGSVVAQESTATFVDAPTVGDFLRELERRELDRVAMAWCRERLTVGKPGPAERFELTLGLARGAARGALSEIGADRETLWVESLDWLDALRGEATAARRVEVDLAAAELSRLRGDWERKWASVRLFDEAAARVANDRLVGAYELVTTVITRLEKTPADASPVRELMLRAERLRAEVSLDLWEHARSCPVPPRAGLETGALSREAATALAYLAEFAKERRQDAALRDTLVLLQARFARLRGDGPRFEEIVKRSASTLSSAGRGRMAAERVWLSGEVLDSSVEQEQSPEWHWAISRRDMDRLRGEWRDSPLADRATREQVVTPLRTRLRRFSTTSPRSWGLLGQQLEDSLDHLVKYGPVIGPLAERAKSAYLAERFDEAVTAYLDGASAAKKRGDSQSEFELAFRGASILVDRSRFDEAARRLTSLVDSQPQHPEAAAADLLACHALGMVAEAMAGDEAARVVIERLTAHLERFPESPRRAEAALRLGQMQLARSEWAEALLAFQRIPPTHASASAALSGMTRAYRELTDLAQGDGDNLTRLADDMRTQWQARLSSDARTWDVEGCDAAVAVARLELIRATPDFKTADDWLNRAEEGLIPLSASAPEVAPRTGSLLAETRRLRVLSLAGRGELESARQMLARLADAEPESLLLVLDGLDRTESSRLETAKPLAQLQRETALRMEARRGELSEVQRLRVDRVLARAYALTGDRVAAIRIYRDLVKTRPTEIEWKIALAEALGDEGGAERLTEAVELWNRIEGTRTPGTVPWCEARLARCELLARGGDKVGAGKLLKLTRLLHPKLGSPEMVRRFAEFEGRLGKPSAK